MFQSRVAILTLVSSRMEKYFPDPEAYQPERWLRNTGQKDIHPFSALTFGHGPRMCIGKRFAEQELFLGLIKVLTCMV